MVFTSSDRSHAGIAPLFLLPNQTFVNGADLKADLKRLDMHYSALPDEVKAGGLFSFASYPPKDKDFLVTRLWDKRAPKSREQQEEALTRQPLPKEAEKALVSLINRFEKESTPLHPATDVPQEEVAHMTITRRVHMRKGKWNRFPPNVKPDDGYGR